MRYWLLGLCLWAFPAPGIVLEDLREADGLGATLGHKTLGYYIGSFDPLHRGHEALAQAIVDRNLCDYVLIYPAWGGDSYKKRLDVSLRLDMLFAVFKDHPRVIVTRLNPRNLQLALTVPGQGEIVRPAFEGMRFKGIIGSDTALALGPNEKAQRAFMTGLEISDEYQLHTLGGCMALPVESYVVSLRAGDDIAPLNGRVGAVPITAILEDNGHIDLSSTQVRKNIQDNKPIDGIVSPRVSQIIVEKNLYGANFSS